MRTGLTAVTLPIATALVAVVACDLGGTTVPGSDVVKGAASCPDVSSVEAVMSIDWAKEFQIDAALGAKVQAGVAGAIELDAFAKKLDADLKVACGGLAKDLGGGSDFENGEAACKAAIKAIGDIKGKLGGGARISVSVIPPKCSVAMDAMADCVAECDANVEPGSVEVKCEPGKLSGTCEAECKGSCDLKAAAKCEGRCEGSCSADFSGRCGGECNGKCDGKTSKGASCAGKCEGSCTANARGSCGGNCEGSCQLKGSAKCDGTCRGECSVEMKAPKCDGKVEPPKASAECNASCETKLSADVQCRPASVAVLVDGAADAKVAGQFKAAIENNLPAILKIAVGMKDQAISAAANGKVVVEGVVAAVKQVKASPAVGARLTACVTGKFTGALKAAASVQASVKVSVDVNASASASGSAGGSAKAG